MSTYTSKPTIVELPADELAAKFADFRVLQTKLDELPEEQRQKIGDVSFTEDSINISTPQVGKIVLKATERTSEQVVLTAENSPVPMSISISMRPLSPTSTEMTACMDVEIPAMLRPIVGPALQKAVDQFGNLFVSLA